MSKPRKAKIQKAYSEKLLSSKLYKQVIVCPNAQSILDVYTCLDIAHALRTILNSYFRYFSRRERDYCAFPQELASENPHFEHKHDIWIIYLNSAHARCSTVRASALCVRVAALPIALLFCTCRAVEGGGEVEKERETLFWRIWCFVANVVYSLSVICKWFTEVFLDAIYQTPKRIVFIIVIDQPINIRRGP